MEQNKTVVIVGEDSSLESFTHTDDSIISCALNSAIMYCEGIVDYHFMNDFGNLDTIPLEDRIRAKNVVIPSYPHIKYPSGFESSSPHYPASKFIENYPVEFRDKFKLIELPTAPSHNTLIPKFPIRYTVAESAVYYMIHLGYRHFRFIGVGDTDDKYSPLIKDGVVKKGFGTLVRKTLIDILTRNGCTYVFPNEFKYDVLTSNESFYLPTSTERFSIPKTIKVGSKASINKTPLVKLKSNNSRSDFEKRLKERTMR